MSDFRVSSTDGQIDGGVFYFIESTAPDNVEGDAAGPFPFLPVSTRSTRTKPSRISPRS